MAMPQWAQSPARTPERVAAAGAAVAAAGCPPLPQQQELW
jgi:hypothetical protein